MPSRAKIALGTTTARAVEARPPNREHRVVHFVGFGGAELLLLLLAINRRQQAHRIVGMVVLALGIELTQHFVLRGRYFEWWDVRDDVMGILAAFLIVDVMRLRRWIST
jgi:hypothetical protein